MYARTPEEGTFNPSAQVAEVEGVLWVWGQFGLQDLIPRHLGLYRETVSWKTEGGEIWLSFISSILFFSTTVAHSSTREDAENIFNSSGWVEGFWIYINIIKDCTCWKHWNLKNSGGLSGKECQHFDVMKKDPVFIQLCFWHIFPPVSCFVILLPQPS